MKEFEGSSSVLIADVDCTAGGKSKCEEANRTPFEPVRSGPVGGGGAGMAWMEDGGGWELYGNDP